MMADFLALVTHLGYMATMCYIARECFKYLTHRLDVLGAEQGSILQRARSGAEFVEREIRT